MGEDLYENVEPRHPQVQYTIETTYRQVSIVLRDVALILLVTDSPNQLKNAIEKIIPIPAYNTCGIMI